MAIKNNKISLSIKILLGVLLLTSLILVVNQPAWFHRELHKDNFVMLKLSKSIEKKCLDTGCEDFIENQIIMESSASGVIFKRVKNKNYVLTAEHFCNAKVQFEEFMPPGFFDNKIQIQDIQGELWDANVVYFDVKNDLCLLETNKGVLNVLLVNEHYNFDKKIFKFGGG